MNKVLCVLSAVVLLVGCGGKGGDKAKTAETDTRADTSKHSADIDALIYPSEHNNEYEDIDRCRKISKELALLSDRPLDEWLKNASLLQVSLYEWSAFHQNKHIGITGTKNGAVVEYTEEQGRTVKKSWKTEIDREEWLDFIQILYNGGVKTWRKEYYAECVLDGSSWSFEILTGDNALVKSNGRNMGPPELHDVKKKMKNYEFYPYIFKYRKKFGVSISAYQLTIREISCGKRFSIKRTENETVIYSNSRGNTIELDIEDWVDIVYALRDEEQIYKKTLTTNRPWNLDIASIEKFRMSSADGVTVITNTSYVRFHGDKLPTFKVSEELKNVLDSINAKAIRRLRG
jgi:hypothetical protein